MAERTIGLRLELNGFKGVITNIKQLEEELRKAKEDLNELEIGGTLFQQLTGEISRAEGQLMNLRKASEGIGLEKQLEGYGKLAGGITSSFAAAQAAVQLFGVESEAVSEAAAQAQNVLTLALSARGIQEVGVGLNIVARTVAEKAATAATNASNAALKGLFTTIAANPVGALVTALGLLVTAMIAFNSEADDAAKNQKEFQDAINKDAGKSIANLNILVSTINDSSQALTVRKKALEDLKKQFPAYFKDLKDEDILTGKVAIAVDDLTAALIRQAQARALQGRIEENAVKQLELQDKLTQATRDRIKAEEDLQDIQNETTLITGGGGITSGMVTSRGGEEVNAIMRVKNATEEEKEAKEALNKVNQKIADDIKRVTDITKQNTTTISDGTENLNKNTGAKDKNVQATDAQIAAEKQLENQLNATDKSLEQTTKLIEELTKTTSVSAPEPKIIEYLTKIAEARKSLETKTLADVFNELGFDVNQANGQFKILNDTIEFSTDTFGEFYDEVRNQLSSGAVNQTVEEFGKTLGDVLNRASKQLSEGLITKESFDALRQITKQYEQFNKLIQTTPGVEKIFNTQSLNEFLKVTKDINIATGIIKVDYDDVTGKITAVDASTVNLSESLNKQKSQVQTWTDELIKYYTAAIAQGEEAFKKEVNNANLTKEQRAKLLEALSKQGLEQEEIIRNISKAQAEGVVNLVQTVVEEESTIRNFLMKVEKLQTDALQNIDEVTKNAILNNTELLIEATQKQNAVVLNEKKTALQNLASVEQQLLAKGIDITKFTEEEKLKIVQAYLDKQVQATKEAETEKRAEQKITLDDVQKALQVISQTLSDVASIAAQAFQLQLDKLTYEYEKDMDMIVGDTEEANAKRIELEKIYQAEKRKIEKQAQLTALKFTLAQAIAQGAQGVINALATIPPPANAIVAGIQAAVTAAQVAIIAQQIAFVQSQTMRRGGIMRMAAGGLAQGPSHEQGGIYAGGGYTIEGNEAIINRQSTLQYSGLLSQINQSGGGRPIMVQSPMDSRLVEALAKQRTEPIRAYVVEQDITKAQNINRRLEQLASF